MNFLPASGILGENKQLTRRNLMIFAHISDKSAETKLGEAIKEADKTYVYRRLMTVQLSSEGKTVTQLADIFKVTPQTIRDSIHAYNSGGLEGVTPHKKPGRSCRLKMTKDQWLEVLHTPPVSFDRLSTKGYNWTLGLLADYLLAYQGVKMSPSNVWYILRRHKINMGRSDLKMTSPDPEYTQKRQRVEQIKKKRKKVN